MPRTPHEYTLLRRSPDPATFQRFVMFIRERGYTRSWRGTPRRYCGIDDWSYWTMGATRRDQPHQSRTDNPRRYPVKVNGVGIIINGDDPEALFRFYTGVVGLPAKPEMGEHAVDAAGVGITFDSHSQATGTAKEPARQLINLFVDDVAAEEARIKAQGVRFIRSQGREFWGGIISTFLDPAGNYVQIIEYRPE